MKHSLAGSQSVLCPDCVGCAVCLTTVHKTVSHKRQREVIASSPSSQTSGTHPIPPNSHTPRREYSKQLNDQRLRVLTAREEAIQVRGLFVELSLSSCTEDRGARMIGGIHHASVSVGMPTALCSPHSCSSESCVSCEHTHDTCLSVCCRMCWLRPSCV